MLLDVRPLDEKQTKYGMTAIRAMALTLDTCAILFLHLPEGCIRLVHQKFITLKQLG
jgi:hypothetical protein